MVLKSFDVTGQDRAIPDGLDKAQQVHHHAGLIAVRVGKDDPGAIRINLEKRSHSGIEFGVHEYYVLAVLDGLQCHLCAEFDLTGCLDDGVDAFRLAKQKRVICDAEFTRCNRVFKLGHRFHG